jgi:hypothetical protein
MRSSLLVQQPLGPGQQVRGLRLEASALLARPVPRRAWEAARRGGEPYPWTDYSRTIQYSLGAGEEV